MKLACSSIFANIPKQLSAELCESLLEYPDFRLERIISAGHKSADGFWYDQAQNEWVLLLQGQARLEFADASSINLTTGDYLLIPAHCKHRVAWTSPVSETIWLAIHFADAGD